MYQAVFAKTMYRKADTYRVDDVRIAGSGPFTVELVDTPFARATWGEEVDVASWRIIRSPNPFTIDITMHTGGRMAWLDGAVRHIEAMPSELGFPGAH